MNSYSDLPIRMDNEIQDLKKRLSQSEAACAEMRDALKTLIGSAKLWQANDPIGTHHFLPKFISDAEQAISLNTGTDFLHKNQIKPIVEALLPYVQHWHICVNHNSEHDICDCGLKEALTLARELGLGEKPAKVNHVWSPIG